MRTWGNTKVPGRFDKFPRFQDLFDVVPFNGLDPTIVRCVGPLHTVALHYIELRVFKADGTVKNPFEIRACTNWNPETATFEDNGCVYCQKHKHPAVKFVQNVIVRHLQDMEPARRKRPEEDETAKTFKRFGARYYLAEKSSRFWTPARVLVLPPGAAETVGNMSSANIVQGVPYAIDDKTYGKDLSIIYDPNAKAAANTWKIYPTDRCEIRKEERRYPYWDIIGILDKAIAPFLWDPQRQLDDWEQLEPKLKPLDNDRDQGATRRSGRADPRDYDATRGRYGRGGEEYEDTDQEAPPAHQPVRRYRDAPAPETETAPVPRRRAAPQPAPQPNDYDDEIPF